MPSTRSYLYLACLPLILGLITGMLTGCAGIHKSKLLELPDNLAPAVELKSVPFYPQEKYQCGPSSLAMALTYSELPITPLELKDQVYTPSQKGSLQMAMIGATRRHGRLAYPISGPESLWPEIAAGHPVIILQNLGLSSIPLWHYAVVIGYNYPERYVILRSGVTERKKTPFSTFERTWARSDYWGIIVLKPTQLPATAREKDYLSAVLGLEKTRNFQAAAEGYQTALTRWPQSLVAYMGLGYSRYRLGDLTGAEEAFRQALSVHPNEASAYNNLADVLLRQGRKEEALEAARKAVAIGGPNSDVYELTLKEILENK